MPTSGGTTFRDSAARSGVGDGDMLIAARQHASSFGAVETDLFLDSPKPSLFDVFSDEFGFPRKKKRVERAQALAPNERSVEKGKKAEANRSSSSLFSIERERPKPRNNLEDIHSNALMFWEGETGIRLAAAKFDEFDGENWRQSQTAAEGSREKSLPNSVTIEERVWFSPTTVRMQSALSPFKNALPEALKFTRFRSAAIPIRAGTQLWSIDQVTFADFFEYRSDDTLLMPGRAHVPDYTVVRFVTSQIDEERLTSLLSNCSPGESHKQGAANCQATIARLAHEYVGNSPRGLEQVERIVDGLRSDFRWTRQPVESDNGQSSLAVFLDTQQGPSYLFSTAASLMLEHLGYETRLATGFYVDPQNYNAAERATAILPQDAHTWVEVNVGHGYWVPFEPTPGFKKPRFQRNWSFWAKKNWRVACTWAVGIACGLLLLYLFRAREFAFLCFIATPALRMMPARTRLHWLSRILDIRWRLIGLPRPPFTTRRRQLQSGGLTVDDDDSTRLLQFFDLIDQVRFGSTPSASERIGARPPVSAVTSMQNPALPTTYSIVRSINRVGVARNPESNLREEIRLAR